MVRFHYGNLAVHSRACRLLYAATWGRSARLWDYRAVAPGLAAAREIIRTRPTLHAWQHSLQLSVLHHEATYRCKM